MTSRWTARTWRAAVNVAAAVGMLMLLAAVSAAGALAVGVCSPLWVWVPAAGAVLAFALIVRAPLQDDLIAAESAADVDADVDAGVDADVDAGGDRPSG